MTGGMSGDERDAAYGYTGKVELHDREGRLTVFDVAGFLYARTREEAAFRVATELRYSITSGTPLGDDDREAGVG